MASEGHSPRLIDRLPRTRGRLVENAPLADITWFRVGGPAQVMFRPEDLDDLESFLRAKPEDVDVTVIGVGSNLLVRDGGVRGVVIRLGRGFAGIDVTPDGIRAGAAALDANVALVARDAGLEGLEFLSGIPGTVGGAVRMNAGAYGREIKDVLLRVGVVDSQGQYRDLDASEIGLAYRHCDVPENWIFTSVHLAARKGDAAAIAARMAEIAEARSATQPIRSRTGGSTFANPPGRKAWELIDAAGCRGLRRGGAQVSEKHCNFLINTGDASAADLEGLGEEVRRRVAAKFDVVLEWEIRRIGVPDRSLSEVVQ